MSNPVAIPAAWHEARKAVYQAGLASMLPIIHSTLAEADGQVLAEPLVSRSDLPAFRTSSVDGWAVRGAGPWRVSGQVLAGSGEPPELIADGMATSIATGAVVPAGTTAILRLEHATQEADLISGMPKPEPEWREQGEEARAGDILLAAGIRVTPAIVALAAACGHDELRVRRSPRSAILVFGDELLTEGPSGGGRVRDVLTPSLPGYLHRLGSASVRKRGPIPDTLQAHVNALRDLLNTVDVIVTTGGTMHGPADHLHQALEQLGAEYLVDKVAVRPGFPMLAAAVTQKKRGITRFVIGLPGNPQSAVVALMSLGAPLLAGITGQPAPAGTQITLGAPVPGRGDYTHLALVRRDGDEAFPVSYTGSAMLRGLAGATGFAVIPPGTEGLPGKQVELVALP